MFGLPKKYKDLTRWVIGVFACCALIYLGLQHIDSLAAGIVFMVNLVKPLLIGIVLALVLNVPMSVVERTLKSKLKLKRVARPIAIVLALVIVFGVFVGVVLLIVPELAKAIKLIAGIAGEWLEQLEKVVDGYSQTQPVIGQYLEKFDTYWTELKLQLSSFFSSQGGTLVNHAVGAAGQVAQNIVAFFMGVVFAIYILSGKEQLKGQCCRVLHAWLPEKISWGIIHVCTVCKKTFHLFVVGQVTEAIILGSLCGVGMVILQIPCAPMVATLVGVTALVPIVGAFVGTIVGAIMILAVDPFKALVFVVFLLILQQIEGDLIYPRVVGTKIKLPAIWVLAAVTIGENLAGPLGMLLGVPAASAAYTLLKEVTCYREGNKAIFNTPTN